MKLQTLRRRTAFGEKYKCHIYIREETSRSASDIGYCNKYQMYVRVCVKFKTSQVVSAPIEVEGLSESRICDGWSPEDP